MTSGDGSLAGDLGQPGGSPQAPSQQGQQRQSDQQGGLPGVLGDVVDGSDKQQPKTMRGLLGLNQGGKNPTASGADAGAAKKIEVDPDELRNAIKTYNEVIGDLKTALSKCQWVEGVQAPGEEFASGHYVTDHKPPAESLWQSIKSHIDTLHKRRDMLQTSLDSYTGTEHTNAQNLHAKGGQNA